MNNSPSSGLGNNEEFREVATEGESRGVSIMLWHDILCTWASGGGVGHAWVVLQWPISVKYSRSCILIWLWPDFGGLETWSQSACSTWKIHLQFLPLLHSCEVQEKPTLLVSSIQILGSSTEKVKPCWTAWGNTSTSDVRNIRFTICLLMRANGHWPNFWQRTWLKHKHLSSWSYHGCIASTPNVLDAVSPVTSSSKPDRGHLSKTWIECMLGLQLFQKERNGSLRRLTCRDSKCCKIPTWSGMMGSKWSRISSLTPCLRNTSLMTPTPSCVVRSASEVLVGLGNVIADRETGQKGKNADVPYEWGIRGCDFWRNPIDQSRFESCRYNSHQNWAGI